MEKDENFSEWFDRVLREAEIVDDRYPVKGFVVYRGWGYGIARRIASLLEELLEEDDHQPVLFPTVIPEDTFGREAEHIAGFSGEVFWVTHAGERLLERRLLLRPTSETAIYPLFKLWIRSHADLPLKIHQTCTVYRYETKATRPLYRGREFIWNEAHTAHEDFEDAERQVRRGVEMYSRVLDGLCLSYLILKRPEFDKFAGAVYSIAFDTWNPDGKVNQIGTVHHLGENFSRAFEVTYEDREGRQRYAHTTCYGLGISRVIAAVIAHHGDDHGLVLPPVVAPKQVVIVPIPMKGAEERVVEYAVEVAEILQGGGLRVVLDDDMRRRPGEKFYRWEMFGVPVRVEVGPREVEGRTVTLVRRDTLERSEALLDEAVDAVRELFTEMEGSLRERSWSRLRSEIGEANTLEELRRLMEERRIVKVNWCGSDGCAERMKEEVAGEIRGMRWDVEEQPTGPCVACGGEAAYVVYVSRAY